MFTPSRQLPSTSPVLDRGVRRGVRSLRALVVCLVAAIALTGCPGSNGPATADDAKRSQSEYDVARDLWLSRGQPRAALEHALGAVELDSENSEAAHLVSLIYLQFCAAAESGEADPNECRLAEAEKFARLAIAHDKDYRDAKNTLGVVLVHRKQYAKAVAVLQPLTEDILYQSPEKAWGNLGWAYLEWGKLDPAIDALQRSIAAQPDFCVGHYRLGLAFEKKRDFTAANGEYTAALETEHEACSGLQEAWLGRARSRIRLKRESDARTDLERCMKLSKRTRAGKDCSALLGNMD
ncbi:MAG: hypothetical protein KC492_00815 [Myxococcales bacterium]|nr:hypothetical protein [Myxococcales bacterium]